VCLVGLPCVEVERRGGLLYGLLDEALGDVDDVDVDCAAIVLEQFQGLAVVYLDSGFLQDVEGCRVDRFAFRCREEG
jgi:hypothetical protein